MIFTDALYDLHFTVIHSILQYSVIDFPSLFWWYLSSNPEEDYRQCNHYSSIPSYGLRFELILLFQNFLKSSSLCLFIFLLLKLLWESTAGCPYSSSPHKVKFELCCVSCFYNNIGNYLLSLLGQTSLFHDA